MKLRTVGIYSKDTSECALEDFLEDMDKDEEADDIAAVKAMKVGETVTTALFEVTRIA